MNGQNWEVGSTWYTSGSITKESNTSGISFAHIYVGEVSLLSTCRSAIGLILQSLGKVQRALVPAFTCHSVLAPFVEHGCDVKGYPLKKNLEIDIDGLSSLVETFKPDVIIAHGYFGFDTLKSATGFFDELRHKGIIVIEDTTQTMFSHYHHVNADYFVGSIRKWFPIPDGAFLSGVTIPHLLEDEELGIAKLKAMTAKYEYITNDKGRKEVFMPLFKEAESILDSRTIPYAISNFSLNYVNNINIDRFSSIRRDNYNRLVNRISHHQEINVIFPEAPTDTVPFLLPVYIFHNRAEFQKFMALHDVFPTVIWTCPDEIKSAISQTVQNIYDEIICFHVDQRYDLADMDKVADIIDSYFNHQHNE